MPQIIPIKDLKNTGEISNLVHESKEPIFITKNGYGDMVIMSMEIYEKNMFMNNVYEKLNESEVDIKEGNKLNAMESLSAIRGKYGL